MSYLTRKWEHIDSDSLTYVVWENYLIFRTITCRSPSSITTGYVWMKITTTLFPRWLTSWPGYYTCLPWQWTGMNQPVFYWGKHRSNSTADEESRIFSLKPRNCHTWRYCLDDVKRFLLCRMRKCSKQVWGPAIGHGGPCMWHADRQTDRQTYLPADIIISLALRLRRN